MSMSRPILDEARIQAKHLDHPNIVKVTGIVSTAEHAALVMELVDGKSLEDELPSLIARPDEVTRIMLAVLDAVGYAHKAGIIHRDLKPANVLLARKGDTTIPKVTDFGIAKLGGAEAATRKKSTHADARMGTLSYMSPEQIRRAKDVTPRSDVFSLGAMLYEMATGHVAFEGDNDFDVMEAIVNAKYVRPRVRNPKIDPTLAAVIEKSLAPVPEDRYASCEEMATALRGKPRAESKVQVDPAPPLPAPPPPKRSMMVGIGLIAVALAIAGVGIALVVKKGGDPRRAAVPAVVPVADTPGDATTNDGWGPMSHAWCIGGFEVTSGVPAEHACLEVGPARGIDQWHWHNFWFVMTLGGNSCLTCWDSEGPGCAAALEAGWLLVTQEQCQAMAQAPLTERYLSTDVTWPDPAIPAKPSHAQTLEGGASYVVLQEGMGRKTDSILTFKWTHAGALVLTHWKDLTGDKDIAGVTKRVSELSHAERLRFWIPGTLLPSGESIVIDVVGLASQPASTP